MKRKRGCIITTLVIISLASIYVIICFALRYAYYPTLEQSLQNDEQQYSFVIIGGGKEAFNKIKKIIGVIKLDEKNRIYVVLDDQKHVVIASVEEKMIGKKMRYHCRDILTGQFYPEWTSTYWTGAKREHILNVGPYEAEGYFIEHKSEYSSQPDPEWMISVFPYDEIYDIVIQYRVAAKSSG